MRHLRVAYGNFASVGGAMTKKRTIATMAALGGMTAAVALLSGQPAAKADELSDLRANQQLLQQRLDQLAQIPSSTGVYPGGPPAPTAGAGIVGGSFPRSFLVPGTDTSIRVGGEIRHSGVHHDLRPSKKSKEPAAFL